MSKSENFFENKILSLFKTSRLKKELEEREKFIKQLDNPDGGINIGEDMIELTDEGFDAIAKMFLEMNYKEFQVAFFKAALNKNINFANKKNQKHFSKWIAENEERLLNR